MRIKSLLGDRVRKKVVIYLNEGRLKEKALKRIRMGQTYLL